jgi:hypothetical protein
LNTAQIHGGGRARIARDELNTTTPSKSIKQSGDTDLLLVIDYFLLAI